MAATQRVGIHFIITDAIVTFFNARGVRRTNGTNWASSATGGALAEIDSAGIMKYVRSHIDDYVAAGRGDQIAELQIDPQLAVVFFLEGILTWEHLGQAVESSEVIVIPGVEINDHIFTVRILNQDFKIAIADSEGKVLR